MPIYAYRCASCGHARDVLQKLSDPLLTVCPACGAETFRKQPTAAGFQLKGSGWYATDFRGGPKPEAAAEDAPAEAAKPGEAPAPAGKAAETTAAAPGEAKAAAPAPRDAAAPPVAGKPAPAA